ncbi:MAG: hypothetical protein R2825_03250 [Saprospiraceae bacterium]
MVYQKNAATAFDFDTEGIKMLVEGDWVKRRRPLVRTMELVMASIMALLESTDIPHPP